MGRRLQTVAAVGCMKTLLMVFNVAFVLAGVVILGLGLWMNADLYKYLELTNNYNGNLAYILIGSGAAIILVGLCACWCTMNGQPHLLYTYAVFLMVVFVFELTAGISGVVYRNKLKSGFTVGLKEAMTAYTVDPEKTQAIDNLQSKLKCCGFEKYSDWSEYPWSNGTDSVPLSCCQVAYKKCNNINIGEETDDIYTKGCYNTIVESTEGNMKVIALVVLVVAFVQLLGVTLSCCLAKHVNKAKYEEV